MNAKKRAAKRITVISLFMLAVIMVATLLSNTIFAADGIVITGEMEKDIDGSAGIAEAFAQYKIQDTVKTKNSDVGGDIQYTVYFDRGIDGTNTVTPGYNGTRILLYAVNTGAERIGTDTNREIISSMLERGYLVVVVDYLNDPKACGLQLATSAAKLQVAIRDGKLFDKTTDVGASVFAKSGSYYETFVVPSGNNVLLENVFWEIDKHAMAGTLDKIVENWNSDFRTAKANKIVKWVKADGTRKSTRTVDGESAVWYSDAAGKTADAESGQYVKVKFTVANTITDCVNPDGTPLEMNLYSNVIYPTSPKNEVPVYVRASAHGDLAACTMREDAHYTLFLFDGYALSSFDYLWQPMALNTSFGYYDGSQGNTGDHMNYGLMMYNDKLVNTAAMRFLRHLSANGGDRYNFALDKIGVMGASKGGWFTFLGEAIIQSPLATGNYATAEEKIAAINAAISGLMSDRYYSTQSGKTRYQTGASMIDDDIYTGEYVIDAGEMQPWLTYPDGSEIISGCQAVYAAVGSQVDDVTAGHVPIFELANLYDDYSAAYGSANDFINLSKNLDIEAYYFDTPLGHSLATGPDLNYGVDTFEAMISFFNYYLKGEAVKVLYTEPRADERRVALTDKITIKFMGSVSETEIGKVVISSESGAVTGSWSAAVGNTEWTFTPDSLSGNTVYTVTVPKGIVGSNGAPMEEDHTYTFVTEYDNSTALTGISGYYTFTAPALTNGNSFAFRFYADGVNTAELYAVENEGDADGTLLGKINVSGAGTYEIDVTDYVIANAGKEVTLLLKEGRGTVSESVINDTFTGAISSNISAGSKVTLTPGAEAGGRTALEVAVTSYTTNGVSKYYLAESKAFTYKNVTGGYVVSESDVGRTYTFSIDIYDIISRTVTFRMNSMTKKANGTLDYDRKYLNVNTKAGEWTTVEFTYTVYETKYGEISNGTVQSLNIHLATDGNAASPLYFSNFKVDEVLTSLNIGNAYIAEKDNGLGAYTAPASDKPFAIYNGDTLVGEYTTFANTIAAYTSGYTVKLQSDYTLTDADLSDKLSGFSTVNIDLGTYTVTCENTKNSLIWIKAVNTSVSTIDITGGNILLGRTALISYEGSTSAGNGKNVNIALHNTYIGFNDNAYTTEIISDTAGVSGVKINSKINLTDCTLDLPEERRAKSNAMIFPTSDTPDLSITYKISGGEIRLTKTRWISILEDKLDLEFTPNASGRYTALITPSYITWDIGDSVMTNAGYASFVAGEAQDGYVTRAIVVPENSTRYGLIPEQYLDAEAYPFVVFDGNGNFIGAYANFMGANKNDGTSAVSRVKNLQASNTTFTNGVMNNKTAAVILLRRDYTYIDGERFDNWAQIAGEITIDLGGHSMYQNTTETTRRSLFVITSKAWTNSSKFPYYWDTTINVINGSLHTYDKTFFSLAGNQSDYAAAGQYVSEKDFTFNFDGVTFALIESSPLTNMMVTCNSAQNAERFVEPAPFNFNYDNCTFDITNGADGITVLDADSDDGKWLKLTFNVKGGKIIAGDNAGITPYAHNGVYGSSIAFEKGENGEYITLVASSDLGEINTPFPTEEGIMYLTGSGNQDGKVIYKLATSPVTTKYGALPSGEEGTEEEMPFAVFTSSSASITGYVYSGVFKTWKEAAAEAVKASGSVIYLRADTTWSNSVSTSTFTGNFGDITVDLNGHTFTKLAGYLVDTGFKNTTPQTTSITFKNGTLVNSKDSTSSQGMFCLNYVSNTALATFNFTFDNVNFINEKTTKMFFSLWENGYSTSTSKGSKSTITFNDCTIDSNGTTLFELCVTASRAEKTDIDVIINGGTIKFTKLLTPSELYIKNADDTVKFGRGKDGKFTTIVIPESIEYPEDVTFEGVGGEVLYYVETGAAGTYYLDGDEVSEYGSIPAKYLAADYPLAVFAPSGSSDTGYTFIGAYAAWKDAAAAAVTASGSVIYLRADATWSKPVSTSTFTGNFGHITVDLNGYTFTRIAGYLIDVYFKNTTEQSTGITFKNGTLVNSKDCTSSQGMFCLNYGNNTALATFDLTFDNVTFINEKTTKLVFTLWEDKYSTSTAKGSKSTITFNDCTIDSNGATVFTLCVTASRAEKTDVDVIINGGTIKFTKALTTSGLYTKNSDDTVKFGKGKNGEYTKIVIPASTAYPEGVAFEGVNGEKLYYVETKTAGAYVLGTDKETENGTIPARYTSEEVYPFFVFFGGEFKSAEKTWKAAVIKARGFVNAAGKENLTAEIVMRRDYDVVSATDKSTGFSDAYGTIVVDLGGYTMSNIDTYVIDTHFNYNSSTSTQLSSIVFKNGTLNNKRELLGMIPFGHEGSGSTKKAFSYTFENVTFRTVGTIPVINDWKHNAPTGLDLNFRFVDCTFDFTGAASGCAMFAFASGRTNVVANFTFEGGNVIADAMNDYNLVTYGDEDTVIAKKNADGEYITVTQLASSEAPTLTMNDGALVFEKTSETETTATYKLVLKAIQSLDFTPKASITLGAELVYNVYVPVADYLKSFTVDGKAYEDLTPVTLADGKQYYKVTVALPAAEAAREIKLIATVSVGEKTATATFTFSVPRYAKKVLMSGSDVEKTLVKDVLSYIRAAYDYFGKSDDAAMADISAILGEDYDVNNAPVLDGSADAPTVGLTGATFVLNSTPAIRFYIAADADPDSYRFYTDGKYLPATAGNDVNGAYVEISVYAYLMGKTVTYTVNGVESGSYHIRSYYEFAKTQDDAKLVTLVERFARYCESAENYRISVTEN